jgi:mono/diheme cytochrome c family protein
MKATPILAGAALTIAVGLPALSVVHAAGAQEPRMHDVAAMTAAQDTAAGRAIFTGKGACFACHGPEAKGTPLAPNLTDTTWINVDGSLESIVKLITEGVPNPKNAPAPMPAKGGAPLTDAEVQAVASYVFALSRPKP